MDKPTKPTNLIPRSFGGVKNNFSPSLQSSGYEDGVPAIYGGDNLNYQLDATGKELDYCEKIVDFINGIPIGKTITVDNNNKLQYADLEQEVPIATTETAGIVKPDGETITIDNDGTIHGASSGANTDLSNLTADGNTKLQYAPFAINAGTVVNGENNTLTYSGSVMTCAPCTITTTDGRTKTFENSSTLDITGSLQPSPSPFVQPVATGSYDGNALKVFGEIGNSTTFAVGVSSAVTSGGSGFELYKGFDSSTSSYFALQLATESTLANKQYYLVFSNPIPLKISSISFKDYSGYTLTSSILEGSNDGSNWVKITTITRQVANNVETVNINSQNSYKYHRIIILKTGYTQSNIHYWDAYNLTINGTVDDTDGTYSVFKDYDTGELSITNDFEISKVNPSTDYWLDTSTVPANMYVNNVIDNDLVYIGDCTISGGAISSIQNRYFNNDWALATTFPKHIIETYQNGTSGYNVWSNGYCEQWGIVNTSSVTNTPITFLKAFKDTNYIITTGSILSSSTADGNDISYVYSKTQTSAIITRYGSHVAQVNWFAVGYIA